MLATTEQTELKPYAKGDFMLLRGRMRDTDRRTFQRGTDQLLDALADGRVPGSVATFWYNGLPAFIGCVLVQETVGQLMGWSTHDVEKCGRELTLAANAFLNVVEEQYGVHRLQCTVLADFDKGIRWMRRLGFEPEGTLRKYTTLGDDCVMMARVL